MRFYLTAAADAELADWRDQRLGLLARVLADLDPGERAQIDAAVPALGHVVSRVRQLASSTTVP